MLLLNQLSSFSLPLSPLLSPSFAFPSPCSIPALSPLITATRFALKSRRGKMVHLFCPYLLDTRIFFTASEFDRWLFLGAHWTNTEERLFVDPENCSVIFNKHDMVRLSDQQVEQCDQAWRFFERIQRLELTPLECVVVTCLGLLTNGK